jgi:hypothetical protein
MIIVQKRKTTFVVMTSPINLLFFLKKTSYLKEIFIKTFFYPHLDKMLKLRNLRLLLGFGYYSVLIIDLLHAENIVIVAY